MTTKRKTQKQLNTQPVLKTLEISYDDNHNIIYSNVVQILQSFYDFKLTFGLIGEGKNNSKITGLETIIISPQHAKHLAILLTENVRLYEEQHMPLPMPFIEGKADTEADTEEVVN